VFSRPHSRRRRLLPPPAPVVVAAATFTISSFISLCDDFFFFYNELLIPRIPFFLATSVGCMHARKKNRSIETFSSHKKP
jgi:hypothetical protein